MPGPNSAPNGNRTLVDGALNACMKHGTNTAKCGKNCKPVTLRAFLLGQNKLATGKTSVKRG